LELAGASYTGTVERFVSGAPLPVTDVVVHPSDGALYFTVGGRGTTSALYRVTYTGEDSIAAVAAAPDPGVDVRRLRHTLETGGTLDLAWPNLSHTDRAVRHAARIAVERHPIELWKDRALAEPEPRARIAALVALARRGDRSTQPKVIDALGQVDWETLIHADRLDLLRAYELAALRPALADRVTLAAIVQHLDPRFPAGDDRLDRELAEILAALGAPGVIPRTLKLLQRAATQEQQIHYAMCLRDIQNGWTTAHRQRFFGWLARSGAHRGGFTFSEYMDRIRHDAVEHLDPTERETLADLIRVQRSEDPYATLQRRALVRKWTFDELLTRFNSVARTGDPTRGRDVFKAALCYLCHRFDGQGSMVGPDLTGASRRFNERDLLEALIEPNRVVSDQYRTSQIALKDGRVLTGKVKDLSGNTLVLMRDPLSPSALLMVPRDAIEETAWSSTSMMPEGLLDTFTADDIVDLMAFLHSPEKRASP
jgi:putative heme-binding domain-containing protein